MEIFKKFKKYSWMINILKTADKEDRKNLIKGYRNRKHYYTNEDVSMNLKDMARCANCPNMCRFDCPALQVSKRESHAPAHKARVAYFLGMDHLSWDDSGITDPLYACMGCDACYQWCPMDISTGDLLFQARAELEKRDLIPDHIQVLKDRIYSNGSVFDHSPFHAESDFNHNDPEPEIFYYIGCMDVKYQPNTVRATMAILEHLGIPYCTHLEQRECCGGPVRKAGFWEVGKTLSAKNKTLIEDTKPQLVISNCPGCVENLKYAYEEEYENGLKVEVQHVVEFIMGKLEANQIHLTEPVKKTIAFHDPCLLARRDNNLNLVDTNRHVLAQIPGLNLKEAYLHGNETRCCGMGGGYAVANPEYSQQLREDRLEQLQKHHPDLIVSACPTCEYAFKKAQEQRNDFENEVVDIIQLVAQSMGLKYL